MKQERLVLDKVDDGLCQNCFINLNQYLAENIDGFISCVYT